VISLVIQARPDAAVNTPIVVTIMLSFAGLALLGTATLRARQLTGRAAWAPLFALAAGLVAVLCPGRASAGRRNGRRARADDLRTSAVAGHGLNAGRADGILEGWGSNIKREPLVVGMPRARS
jgi:hypothetical protein